jgi:hypothetical protein
MSLDTVALTPGDADPTVDFVVSQAPGADRRTVRSSPDGTQTLTIAYQSSGENKGFDTQRTNIRITSVVPTTADPGKSITEYVQLTFSHVKNESTRARIADLTAMLLNFVVSGDSSSPVVVNSSADLEDNVIQRIFAGLP